VVAVVVANVTAVRLVDSVVVGVSVCCAVWNEQIFVENVNAAWDNRILRREGDLIPMLTSSNKESIQIFAKSHRLCTVENLST
jgi:hypothetical protein